MIKKLDRFESKMRTFMSTYTGAFLLCFWQVLLVSINTYQIANHKWVGIAIFAFLISFFWTYNVTIVMFGDWKQRAVYALGGSVGCLTGGLGTYYYYVM